MASLLGVAVVLFGLLARMNPIVVVTASALVAGLGGGLDLATTLRALGKGFNDSRFISVAFLVLPVIGLLERAGLQARARTLVARLSRVSVGGMLTAYLAARLLSAALGLLSLGGQATMVRPLLAPMVEAEEALRDEREDSDRRILIRAHAAAVDNIGAFFGEDIFVALGSVLLIQAVLAQSHIHVQPLRVALWAIPTAAVAFLVHAARLRLLDRHLAAGARR
jgi:uncharacterized membrane protein